MLHALVKKTRSHLVRMLTKECFTSSIIFPNSFTCENELVIIENNSVRIRKKLKK